MCSRLSGRFSGFRRFLTGSVAALALAALPSCLLAQSQSDASSVAEAAKRTREQKKNATKPVRTLTNDDLPSAPAANPQPASAAAAAGESANPEQAKPEAEGAAPASEAANPSEAKPASTDEPAKKKAIAQAALKRVKAELAQAQGELGVLQRKAVLDSDSYYSQTDYSRDTDGKAKLDADAQQVNDKKAQVEDLKAKVAALEAEAGGTDEAAKPQ